MSDQSLINDLNALLRPRQRKDLKPLEPRGDLPGRRVSVPYVEPVTGGGIASPLTEKTKVVDGKAVPDKDYWPAGFTSSDGLFVLPAWKTWNLTDANGDDVVIEFADPQGAAV